MAMSVCVRGNKRGDGVAAFASQMLVGGQQVKGEHTHQRINSSRSLDDVYSPFLQLLSSRPLIYRLL
jgi:hypothetical protein